MKAGTIQEVRFGMGSLTAIGSFFDVYSPESVNGTIQSISVGNNSYSVIGSVAFYWSGTDNAVEDGLIIRLRAGSVRQTFYPFVQQVDNQSLAWTAGSIQTWQSVGNAPIRIVGSGLRDAQSGLNVVVRYI